MHGGHRTGRKWIEEVHTGVNLPKRLKTLIRAIAHALDQQNQYLILDNWQNGNDISVSITEDEIIITIKKIK